MNTKSINFGLIGNGIISARHKEAIKSIGGRLKWICDPTLIAIEGDGALFCQSMPSAWMYGEVDFVVICSPTKFHRQQTQKALLNGCQVICEKPLCLPWEPLIDDDNINICLQLRYIENLPKKADLVRAVMVRDEAFFKTWKGDPRQAGGNLYEFYIHYIDLAIQLDSAFEGEVLSEGKQVREIITNIPPKNDGTVLGDIPWLGIYDIMAIDMQDLYNLMYVDIVNGGGIKPKDIFYLKWVLDQTSLKYGFGCREKIVLPKGLL
jgi:hypothetical protein